MIEKLIQLQTALANRRTYTFGLLQAKVYRSLKNHTKTLLKPFEVSTIEWALLGLVYESGNTGLRSVTLAKELGVEMPFITTMVDTLEKRKFLTREPDPSDRRAKLIKITKAGKAFVEKVEVIVRDGSRPMLTGISKSDLLTYITVLHKLKNNATDEELATAVTDVPPAWGE